MHFLHSFRQEIIPDVAGTVAVNGSAGMKTKSESNDTGSIPQCCSNIIVKVQVRLNRFRTILFPVKYSALEVE